MGQTFNQYNKGNATLEDIQNAWENGQLPDDVLEYFEDAIDDVVIRSLEQSGYNLYKESLIVDNFIKVNDSLLVVTNNGKDWQIVFYQYGVYQEISFVNNEKNLLKILIQLLTEYNKR